MIEIHADELRVGDVIDYGGQAHRVTHVVVGPGWSWPVAADDSGWAIALDHHVIAVQRDAA